MPKYPYRNLGTVMNRLFRNAINDNFKDVETDIKEQKDRVDTLIKSTPQPSEVVDSRGGFPVLGDRLASVDSQLAQIAQFDKKKETILYTAFNGVNGNELALWISQDGINLKPLHTNSLYRYGLTTGDPSIIYYNDNYYITFTTSDSSNPGGFIGIAKTKDFINYETTEIRISGYSNVWAPQWFVDGDNVYLLISMSDGTYEVDVFGNNVPFHKSYYLKANDTNLNTFSSPVLMSFSKTNNRIDPTVYKIGSTYHLFVKNEFNKTMEHYTYSGSTIEGITWTYLQTIDYGRNIEGPSLAYFQGKYWLYGDGFDTASSWVVTSTDLINWSAPTQVVNENNIRTRHFDVLVLNEKQKNDIVSFLSRNSIAERNDIIRRTNPFKVVLELKNYVTNKVFSPAKNQNQEVVYVTYGSDSVVINSINIDTSYENPKDLFQWTKFNFGVFGTGTITFEHNSVNGVLTPYSQNFVIGKNYGSNDTIITIEKIYKLDKFYRIRNAFNFEQALKNSAYLTTFYSTKENELTTVDLATLAVGGIVNNLVLQPNTLYFSFTGAITINSVDPVNIPSVRGRVYFVSYGTAVGDSITFVHGAAGKIIMPGAVNYVLSFANKNDNKIVSFTKASNSLRLIGN